MSRSNTALYVTMGMVSATLLGAYIALSVVIGAEFALPAMITGAVMGTLVLRGQVGRAIAERIHSGPPQELEVPAELVEELDMMRGRLAELEERVDFAERMLARPRAEDSTRLPPG